MEKQPEPESRWLVKDRFLELRSRWLTLIRSLRETPPFQGGEG